MGQWPAEETRRTQMATHSRSDRSQKRTYHKKVESQVIWQHVLVAQKPYLVPQSSTPVSFVSARRRNPIATKQKAALT